MNGDVLTTLDYLDLMTFSRRNKNMLTIAVHNKKVKIDLELSINSENEIDGYIEKPEMKYQVSMGIYVYDPIVLSFIVKDKYLDFPDLVLNLILQKQKVMAYKNDAQWLDIRK